jgi:hypothetical protein
MNIAGNQLKFFAEIIAEELEQSSLFLADRTALEKAVRGVSITKKIPTKDGTPYEDKEDFFVENIDWGKLGSSDGVQRWLDMMQSLPHSCLLNSVRFVLQRRHDVMIGKHPNGDRIVWSLIQSQFPSTKRLDGYVLDVRFSESYSGEAPGAKNLDVARKWLGELGFAADKAQYVPSLADYIDGCPAVSGTSRIIFVAGRSTGVPHNYVIYDIRPTSASRYELKVYDPWTGKNLIVNNSEWIEVDHFQMNYGLFVGPNGEDFPPDGVAFHYPVLFIRF